MSLENDKPRNTTSTEQHNVLPKRLEQHCYAGKYQYVDYDTELDMPLDEPGFYVDSMSRPFVSPLIFNDKADPFEDVRTRTMEEGDFLLCCPVKTGQHWVWTIMNMLLAGKAEHTREDKESTWVDIQPLDEIYAKSQSPRVLCTHLTLSWLPQSFRRPSTKVVVTMRNLKDAFVSNYHHVVNERKTKLWQMDDSTISWSNIFRLLLRSKYNSYGSYFDLYGDLWDNYRDDPNVLIVLYEDLKRNTEQVIQRIAKHMGVQHTPQLIAEIAAAVDINKMKEVKSRMEALNGTENSTAIYYRKGEIGDWKNTFTVAQNEEFDRKMAEWNKDRQIPFTYE